MEGGNPKGGTRRTRKTQRNRISEVSRRGAAQRSEESKLGKVGTGGPARPVGRGRSRNIFNRRKTEVEPRSDSEPRLPSVFLL